MSKQEIMTQEEINIALHLIQIIPMTDYDYKIRLRKVITDMYLFAESYIDEDDIPLEEKFLNGLMSIIKGVDNE